MIIGVDGGALSISDERLKLGVYWVNVNLLRALGKLDKKNSYVIYSFIPIDRELMKSFGPRMENKVLRPARGWFSLRLPLELSMHPVDLFLGISQAIPTSSSRNIGIIYDLGFLHHPDAYPGSHNKLKQQTDAVVRKADAIIAISHAVKTDVEERYGLGDKKIRVAYPGVDKTFTSTGKRFIGRHPYFLFVGALKPGKNVPTLINGFAEFLRKQKKNYDLYLLGGEFWKDERIDSEIVRLGLNSRILKLGFVPDSQLASYYRGAVSFVSPSLYEGFCLPAIEAMACGCPVLGSTDGAMPEIVGNAGILIDPMDIEAMVNAMNSLAGNEKLRKSYRRKGIIRAKQYSWDLFGKTIYRLIHDFETQSS